MTTEIESNKLFEKYNISPSDIQINGTLNDICDKNFIIYYLLKSYELAANNFKKGSITLSSYAAAVVLDDMSVHFGVNLNNTRNEISSVCAERSALIAAFTNKVKEFKENFNYKIKYILMSAYKDDNTFWSDKITPCADCLAWFNTGARLSIDTKIISLKKKEGILFIDVQPLDLFLPQKNRIYKTVNNVKRNTEILRTHAADFVQINNNTLISLYKKTYTAYKNNKLSDTSAQNIAVGVLSGNKVFTGVKVDFSKRWFIDPLTSAVYKAVEKFKTETKIDAICYVGENSTVTETGAESFDGLINIKTLGRLNTKFANSNTLILTGTDTGLFAAVMADYFPSEHKFIHDYEIK